MKLLIVCALMTIAAGAPGLLRIPKVYNAVITSNQNLSPSRAFPVIQPVIHRTAIGYVPPFYYTQIAPHYSPLLATDPPTKPSTKDQDPSSTSRLVESTSFGIGRERDQRGKIAGSNPRNGDTAKENPPAKKKKHEQAPLSFYPSYPAASIYYEPYVYTYNDGVDRHLVPPGTYYIDYQPYGLPLKPIPASAPNNADSGHLLPSFHDEKTDRQAKTERHKIPDVPPPPLPTSLPNRA